MRVAGCEFIMVTSLLIIIGADEVTMQLYVLWWLCWGRDVQIFLARFPPSPTQDIFPCEQCANPRLYIHFSCFIQLNLGEVKLDCDCSASSKLKNKKEKDS